MVRPLILPSRYNRPRQAQLQKKVVFYKHKNGRIVMGFPEEYPAPETCEKIVCNSAHEAEVWSERMRAQEKAEREMSDYEREMIEGPMREQVRGELRHQMANARTQASRDFCRLSLEYLEDRAARGKRIITSYLHAEAHEAGK